MKPPATFETLRLHLRPPVMEDAPVIFTTWAQDPEVSRYVTWPPHRSVDDTRGFLRYDVEGWEKNGPFAWAIANARPLPRDCWCYARVREAP